jgi:hypothetical protein
MSIAEESCVKDNGNYVQRIDSELTLDWIQF